MKLSLFKRLRDKIRGFDLEKSQLKDRIRQLESSVASENKKACELHDRLHRLVNGHAFVEHSGCIVRLCVTVDRRTAEWSGGNAVYGEATRQLMSSLHKELSRN